MKIKIKEITYAKFQQVENYKHFKPRKPSPILTGLAKIFTKKELKDVDFTYTTQDMDKVNNTEPCFFIMNHSCFLDIKIALKMISPRPFNTVVTEDGFIGKKGFMKMAGAIPTKKFITDITVVKDCLFAAKHLHDSILMFPEASYSFDGTATPLPTHFAKFVKMLGLPVVMIQTHGAYLHDPLYNNLQLRNVKVSATMTCLLSHQEVQEKSLDEIKQVIEKNFDFDNFKEQITQKVKITEPFRADCLNRILYQCPSCLTEHEMVGEKNEIHCNHCGATYELSECGEIRKKNKETNTFGQSEFPLVSDWYKWERKNVLASIKNHTYKEILDVDIYGLKDLNCIYHLGNGKLTHSEKGFDLVGDQFELKYHQEIEESYSLYSDFFWYEIGDIICIGDYSARYYCVPKTVKDVVAKVRLAAEELYKENKKTKQ